MLNRMCIATIFLLTFCSIAIGDLKDNGDGTVTDTITGLMWQQADPGQMPWISALIYCEGLTLAGHDDWRLPNRNELQSIVHYGTYKPAISLTLFPEAFGERYWSSTTYANSTDTAWSVFFNEGQIEERDKSKDLNVRAVRGGQ